MHSNEQHKDLSFPRPTFAISSTGNRLGFEPGDACAVDAHAILYGLRQRMLYCGPTAKTQILMQAGIRKPAQFWSAVMQTKFDTL